MVHIHGTGDEFYPLEGTDSDPSVGEQLAYWANHNECDDTPIEEKNNNVIHYSYMNCMDGIDVEYYVIEGGHAWPQKDINASQIIWDFFAAHPKP